MSSSRNKISTSGKMFVDQQGRQVILHGINMVCKERERNYIGDYTKEDFQLLKQWGFNVIRLGIFWDGIEKTPGCYEEEYLKKVDELIALAAEQEIAVYLDMHQDLFSYKYSDGAPEWATLTEGFEHVQTELWSESYLLSDAVQHAFDAFWNDTVASDGVGIQTHFINMWQHLAKRYASNEAVIGYDFFNEPFPGSQANMIMADLMRTLKKEMGEEIDDEILMAMWLDQEKKLELLNRFNDKKTYKKIVAAIAPASQEFDQKSLNDFYQRIGRAVREVDESTLLFLEANYFSNTGVETKISPVTNKSGEKDEYQVFSPHGYDLMVDTQMYEQASFDRLEVIFDAHKKAQDRMELPILVGEWGCFPNAGAAEEEQAQLLMNLFSEKQFSDTYFDFSHIKNNRILSAIVRPFPMCVAGELLSYQFDAKTRSFTCHIKEQKEKESHRIFVPDVSAMDHLKIEPANSMYHIEYCTLEETEKHAGYLVIDTCGDTVERRICFQLEK